MVKKERTGNTHQWTIALTNTTITKQHRGEPISPEALGRSKNSEMKMKKVITLMHSDINQYTAMNSVNQIGEEGQI